MPAAPPQDITEWYGVGAYVFKELDCCWSVGGRLEWWKSNTPTASQAGAITDMQSYYAVTGGINYKPHANVVIRPEVRYNWTPAEDNYAAQTGFNDYNQATFGVDAIFTF